MRQYVEDHSDHTLKKIGQAVKLSASKVWKNVKKLDLTRKKKTTLYKERDDVKRAEFLKTISQIAPETPVYVDEAGVDNRLFGATKSEKSAFFD